MSFPQRELLLKHFETHKSQQQAQPKQLVQHTIVSQDTQKLLQDSIDEVLRDSGDATPKIHFFSCQVCSLTFIQETYYKQHMETHKRDSKKGAASVATTATHTSNSTVQSLIKQEVRTTGTPTTIIQTQGNQSISDNDLEIMFEKMHSEKTEIEGNASGGESLVITSQESSTGGYTFNITMPAHQLEQAEHNAGAEGDEVSVTEEISHWFRR